LGAVPDTPFSAADCPVLQVVFASGTEESWVEGTSGLSARDIAMNVALPEVDGRILSRAVSFKAPAERDPETQTDVVIYRPRPDRVRFVAALAAAWARLRQSPTAERRLALVLSNYPNRDGRMGNGVGLDTPAAAVAVLAALAEAGYDTGPRADIPTEGSALMALLRQGVTNDLAARAQRLNRESLELPHYLDFFHRLPQAVQEAVTARWGAPEDDPHFVPGEVSCGGFALSVICFGRVVVGVQPARGYNIDPVSSYHDPARLLGLLRLAARGLWGPCPGPYGEAWHPGMATRQGPSAIRGLLSRGSLWALAAPLPLYRQRPRRRHPGQAAGTSGDHRPPNTAFDSRRELWAAERPRTVG
jgi:cobaltochelatase CobN